MTSCSSLTSTACGTRVTRFPGVLAGGFGGGLGSARSARRNDTTTDAFLSSSENHVRAQPCSNNYICNLCNLSRWHGYARLGFATARLERHRRGLFSLWLAQGCSYLHKGLLGNAAARPPRSSTPPTAAASSIPRLSKQAWRGPSTRKVTDGAAAITRWSALPLPPDCCLPLLIPALASPIAGRLRRRPAACGACPQDLFQLLDLPTDVVKHVVEHVARRADRHALRLVSRRFALDLIPWRRSLRCVVGAGGEEYMQLLRLLSPRRHARAAPRAHCQGSHLWRAG